MEAEISVPDEVPLSPLCSTLLRGKLASQKCGETVGHVACIGYQGRCTCKALAVVQNKTLLPLALSPFFVLQCVLVVATGLLRVTSCGRKKVRPS